MLKVADEALNTGGSKGDKASQAYRDACARRQRLSKLWRCITPEPPKLAADGTAPEGTAPEGASEKLIEVLIKEAKNYAKERKHDVSLFAFYTE